MPTVSMRDVATHAGVSTATVSHVINNTRYVAEETRQRVLDAVKALNYNPNAMARILRTGRKGIIGFLIPDISNPFYSELIEEVETVFFEQGYRLLLSNSHEDADRELENMRVMSSGIVDGVLVASSLKDCNELNGIVPEGLPMVFLDQVVPNCSCDIVRVNTYHAVAEATEELIRNGHTRIACFRNSTYLFTAVERFNAYQEVMRRHNLKTEAIPFPAPLVDFSPFLEQALSNGITALVTTNGRTSNASVEYLYKRGMVLGKDIDLVVFQDEKMPHFFYPQVSIVRQPVQELGQAAARQLLWRINHPDQPAREILLQASYFPKSCGA